MSEAIARVRCVQCGKSLKLPAGVTRPAVRCPACKAIIPVTESAPEAPIRLAEPAAAPPPLEVLVGGPIDDPEYRRRKKARRRREARQRKRNWLAVPWFAVAFVLAGVTAWLSALRFFGDAVGAGWFAHSDQGIKAEGMAILMVGMFLTLGAFWVAECIRQGKWVSADEAFEKVEDEE